MYLCAPVSRLRLGSEDQYLPLSELPYGLGVPIQDVPLPDLSRVLMVSQSQDNNLAYTAG